LEAGALRYLAFRIARAALTAFAVVTLVFVLIRAVPGDPVDAMLGEQASPEDRAAVRRALHLDESLSSQYGRFLADVFDGTLGSSFRAPDKSVRSLIEEAFPPTLQLALAALTVAWLVGIPLGVIAAARRGTAVDRVASFFALTGLALPTIWLGPLLVLFFAVKLRWLPLPGDDITGGAALVLPATTIGLALAAGLTRQTRAAMLEVLAQPYVAAARARGVGRFRVFFQHALRNAMLPVLTLAAAQVGALLSGAVIAEKIFERPGLGTLFLEGFFARDIPVVQGVVLLVGLIYVAVNVALDLTYAVVDPRVRLDGS
jgi:ABC-type dipeptide/oligopeptide/nickel transport system permease component